MSKGWYTEVQSIDKTIQVYPCDDLKSHVLVGQHCPCQPRTEQHKGLLVIHNSYDGREFYEVPNEHSC